MALSQLFSALRPADEAVKSAVQPAFTLRSETEGGRRGAGRKRKTQGEHRGSSKKKPCYQVQGTTTPNNFKDKHTKAKGEHGFNGCCSGRGRKSQKWQQQGRKLDVQKDQGRRGNEAGRPKSKKGGRGGRQMGAREDFQMKPRFMTQEFKDQNALLVDGRLICRHFLWGRCIKADECQLEHIQGYNGLIKEACKFYIQGFCLKGESCVYMHKTFPCKFFHRKGKCSQGEGCRFSHKPLTDVTEKLLDEFLKRDSELAQKAEQIASGQPANADEPEIKETKGALNILVEHLRPNFYNSKEVSPEKETSSCQTEEVAEMTDEAIPPPASDTAQPRSPPSTDPTCPEPVCYSVEAVLGPQLYRPFPIFYNAPGSQETSSLPVTQATSEATSGCATQNEVPYSVDAVLSSFKSVEKSTIGQRPAPPTVRTEENTDPLLRSHHQNEKVSFNTRDKPNKSQEKMFKSLSSLQAHSSLNSGPGLSLCSGDHKRCGDMPESLKTAQRGSHEVKPELLHAPLTNVANSASSKSKEDVKEIKEMPTDTPPPKCPTQLKPHLSGRSAAPAEPAASCIKTSDSTTFAVHHFAAEQIHQYPKRTQPGLKPGTKQHKETTCGDFSFECKKTQKIPFNRLFANRLNDSVTATPDSVRTPQAADFASKGGRVEAKREPDKTSATSFLSLFATPLSETWSAPPYSQPSVEKTFHSSKGRASSLEPPPSCQVGNDVNWNSQRPSSHMFSPRSKTETDPAKQPLNPGRSLVPDSVRETPSSSALCDSNLAESPAQQKLPDLSSPKRTATSSVLKSLFLSLSPFQEDAAQQDHIQNTVPRESEMNIKGSVGIVFGKQQHEPEKHWNLSSRSQFTVKDAAYSSEDHPSFKTPQDPSDRTGVPTLSSHDVTEPQVRNSGTDNFPLESATVEMHHHTEARMKHTSEEGKQANGSVAVTPLKDLFKTLDDTGFHL